MDGDTVGAAAVALAPSVGVIVLAPAAMAHLATGLSETLKKPVLESPSLCIKALAPYLKE